MKRKGFRNSICGFTLFELVVTLTVLSIIVMGTLPLAQNAVRRQREVRLRETLRQIRNAIDEFKRDTYGACPQGAISTGNPAPGGPPRPGQTAPPDPRSRVVIDDCTIFDNDSRASSLLPAVICFRAVLSIASARRSFGTESMR